MVHHDASSFIMESRRDESWWSVKVFWGGNDARGFRLSGGGVGVDLVLCVCVTTGLACPFWHLPVATCSTHVAPVFPSYWRVRNFWFPAARRSLPEGGYYDVRISYGTRRRDGYGESGTRGLDGFGDAYGTRKLVDLDSIVYMHYHVHLLWNRFIVLDHWLR